MLGTARNLIITNGFVQVDRGLSTNALSLLNGSTLTHRQSRVADGPTGVPRLEIEATTLTIDATSSIDVTAKGYLENGRGDNTGTSRGRTIGNATGSSRGGGSYGGRGGDLSSGVYGDYQDPNYLGSGGGGNNSGGSGGGLVRITADTLVMDGAIRAVGGLGGAGIGASSGNGSGGGIRIDTRILSGDGVISAEGGEQSGRQGGGGGRIAIYYQDISGFDTSNISARGGGGKGGAGTIYLKGTAQANGDLIIDNVGVDSQHSTGLRSVAPGVSTGLEANTLTDGTASFSVPNPVTGRVGLIGLELNPDTTQGQTFTIIGNTATQIFTDPADGAMTDVAMSGDGYVGQYIWDNADILGNARVQTLNECIVTGTLTVTTGSQLECSNLLAQGNAAPAAHASSSQTVGGDISSTFNGTSSRYHNVSFYASWSASTWWSGYEIEGHVLLSKPTPPILHDYQANTTKRVNSVAV